MNRSKEFLKNLLKNIKTIALVGASSNHTGQLLAVGADTTPALGRLHGKAGVDNEFHTVMLMNLY